MAPEQIKDLTAVRAFKGNQLHQPGSSWKMKLSHLGTLGATLPSDYPQGHER